MTNFKVAPKDIYFVFRNTEYQAFLLHESSFQWYLEKWIKVADSTLLAEYPQFIYEHLDFFYRTKRLISIMNTDVMHDLFNCYSFRGKIIACWMLLINPQNNFLEMLEKSRNYCPEPNQWIHDLALAEIKQQQYLNNVELQQILNKFRGFCNLMGQVAFKDEIRKISQDYPDWTEPLFVNKVRQIYLEEGVEKANQFIKNSNCFSYF